MSRIFGKNEELNKTIDIRYMRGDIGNPNFPNDIKCYMTILNKFKYAEDCAISLRNEAVILFFHKEDGSKNYLAYRDNEHWEKNISYSEGELQYLTEDAIMDSVNEISEILEKFENRNENKEYNLLYGDDIVDFALENNIPYSYKETDLYLPVSGNASEELEKLLLRYSYPGEISFVIKRGSDNQNKKYYKIPDVCDKWAMEKIEKNDILRRSNPYMGTEVNSLIQNKAIAS